MILITIKLYITFYIIPEIKGKTNSMTSCKQCISMLHKTKYVVG